MACWWVCSNVVSTLETLAAFVLHITGAGTAGRGCKWWNAANTRICSIEETAERAAVVSNPSPCAPYTGVTIRPTSSTFNLGFYIPGLTLHDTNNSSKKALTHKKNQIKVSVWCDVFIAANTFYHHCIPSPYPLSIFIILL